MTRKKSKVSFTEEQKTFILSLISDLSKGNKEAIEHLNAQYDGDIYDTDNQRICAEESAIQDTFTLVTDAFKKISTKPMEVCVYVRGGVVHGAIGTHPIAVHVFDVDNMSEDYSYDEIFAQWDALKKTHPIPVL